MPYPNSSFTISCFFLAINLEKHQNIDFKGRNNKLENNPRKNGTTHVKILLNADNDI